MELWVRSQDKEKLIKVDNVRIKHEYEQKKANDNYGITCAYINGKYRCSYIYTDSTWLGEYKTKERALEVLDEIQNILSLKDMYKYDRELILKSWENVDEEQVKIVREQMSVYEMPQE